MKKIQHKQILIVIGIIIFTLTNCKYDVIGPKEIAEKEIIGEWEWVLSKWGRCFDPNGCDETPESRGETKSRIYMDDNIAEYYNNGILTSTQYYKVDYDEEIIDNLQLFMFNDRGRWAPIDIYNDTLVFLLDGSDQGNHYYLRVK